MTKLPEQFKEELELLSNVYGRNFISVSIFSENEASMKFLEKKLKLGASIGKYSSPPIAVAPMPDTRFRPSA